MILDKLFKKKRKITNRANFRIKGLALTLLKKKKTSKKLKVRFYSKIQRLVNLLRGLFVH